MKYFILIVGILNSTISFGQNSALFSDWVNIWDYAGGREIDNGVEDASAALKAALASGKVVYIPNPKPGGEYAIRSQVLLIKNCRIEGASRHLTRLTYKVPDNLNMFLVQENVQLENLNIIGDKSSSGKGLVMLNGEGRQIISNCKFNDFGTSCVFFERYGGSQSSFINIEAQSANLTSFAFEFDEPFMKGNTLVGEGEAVPRSFINIQTQGKPSFNFGGANNVYVSNSFLANLKYSPASSAILISNCRIANAPEIIFDGHNNTIVGCDIYPKIIIAPGADNNAINGNSYNQTPFILDSSLNGRNAIGLNLANQYEVQITSAGTIQPSLGNGTVKGEWTRSGSMVTITVELIMGSTTKLGNGDLRFSIPTQVIPYKSLSLSNERIKERYGSGVCTSFNENKTVVTLLATGTNYLTGIVQASSKTLSNGSPYLAAAGNSIRLSITFSL